MKTSAQRYNERLNQIFEKPLKRLGFFDAMATDILTALEITYDFRKIDIISNILQENEKVIKNLEY